MGEIMPHAAMLSVPPDQQRLYKIMRVEDLLRSIRESYLYFNRVDAYADYPDDGAQLPGDRDGNAASPFASSSGFSAADYYDRSRGRTYATCLSVENSDAMWRRHGNGGALGKVSVIFEYGKLRSRINRTMQRGSSGLLYNGVRCLQVFSVNYGLVRYVDRNSHRANTGHLPNPVEYTYLKDERFADEKELRVSLFATGMGQFVLGNGTTMKFPPSLHLDFNFRAAIADQTIVEILFGSGCDRRYLETELGALGIGARHGDSAPNLAFP